MTGKYTATVLGAYNGASVHCSFSKCIQLQVSYL